MGYIAGVDRDQQVLLPEVLDDYVGAENPVRFIDAFVASLDLIALRVAVGAQGTGAIAFKAWLTCAWSWRR